MIEAATVDSGAVDAGAVDAEVVDAAVDAGAGTAVATHAHSSAPADETRRPFSASHSLTTQPMALLAMAADFLDRTDISNLRCCIQRKGQRLEYRAAEDGVRRFISI